MKAIRAACAILLAVTLMANPAFAAIAQEAEAVDSEARSASADNGRPDAASGPGGDAGSERPDAASGSGDNAGSLGETGDAAHEGAREPEGMPDAEADDSPASPGSAPSASPRALTDTLTFKTPTDGYYSSTSLHYRESGTSDWTTATRLTDTSGFYTFAISAFSLDDDTTYEYVISLLSPSRTTNIAGLVYHKVVGTFSHASDGSWTHANNNGEEGIVSQVDEIGTTTVTLVKAPKYLAYKARAFAIETNVELGHAYATVPDALDHTASDMPNETNRWRKTFYVPASSYDTSPAAKAALANAGYPYIGTEQTDPDANTVNIEDFSMPYTVSVSLYETARGTYHPNGHLTTHKLEDTLEPDPDSNHAVSVKSRQTATQFMLDLTQASPSVLVSGLYPGSSIAGKTPADEALITVSDASGGMRVEFDVGADTVDVHLELVGSGLFTVPVTFTVDGNTGSIVFAYEAEAAPYVEAISFDENNLLAVKQLPKLSPEQNGPVVSARSESLFEYIQSTRSYHPGVVTKGVFRIENTRDDASFRIVDYRVSPNYRPFEKLLRTDSPAIRACFSRYFPDETYTGKVRHLYDFEALTGESLSDALLSLYQERYPSIESLSDLPTKVLAHEIFFDGGAWNFSVEQIDLSKDVYDRVSDSYVILETDPVMQALANELLYERSLSITFDDSLYPLAELLNVDEELDRASAERLRLLYPSYRDRAETTGAMMDDIMGRTPVLGPAGTEEGTVLFDEFAFGLNGYFISNPYIKSNYEFSFDFEVILSVVGIEGVAFLDENRNGIRDDGEKLLESVPITLQGPAGELGTYRTDEFGRYEIPNVAAGAGYRLTVETPEGLEITSTVAADSLDGNKFLPTGETDAFEVEAGEAYRYNVGFATPVPADRYTLTYHPNGGNGTVVDPTGPYAANTEAVVLPHDHDQDASTGFSREGHEFIAWNEQPDGTGRTYAPSERIVMDGHKTLYAQWRPAEAPNPGPPDPGDPPDAADPKPLPVKDAGASKLAAAGDAAAGALALLAAIVAGSIAFALARARRGNG